MSSLEKFILLLSFYMVSKKFMESSMDTKDFINMTGFNYQIKILNLFIFKEAQPLVVLEEDFNLTK
jgi:hypothetical protein